MGLFDKKYCDICSVKIGLLGNRKLEDGNMCKECASKLSPLFNERRSSTVEEIKEQLAYREENKKKINNFNPDMCFGESKKIYVDNKSKKFIVTSTSKWREYNPDIIDFSQIINIDTKIEEDKEEMYYKDEEGHSRSYNPPRYECEYLFMVNIYVNSPWFDKIELELSDGNRPDSPYTDLYRKYEKDFDSIKLVLISKGSVESDNQKTNLLSTLSDAERKELEELAKTSTWRCEKCHHINITGKLYCEKCSSEFSDFKIIELAKNIAKAKNLTPSQGLDANNDAKIGANLNNEVKSWKCEYCGTDNLSIFCTNCGAAH